MRRSRRLFWADRQSFSFTCLINALTVHLDTGPVCRLNQELRRIGGLASRCSVDNLGYPSDCQ